MDLNSFLSELFYVGPLAMCRLINISSRVLMYLAACLVGYSQQCNYSGAIGYLFQVNGCGDMGFSISQLQI